MCHFVGASRPGCLPDMEEIRRRFGRLAEKIHCLETPELEISSTDIRERVRQGKTVRYIVPEAVENAKENTRINGVTNVEFICADAGQAAAELHDRGIHPDCIVVDPPRKGMYPEAVDAIIRMSPARIVYVSCDPATLARDSSLFGKSGYQIISGTAVDMFPHTPNHQYN